MLITVQEVTFHLLSKSALEQVQGTRGKEQDVDCVTKFPECKTMAELDGVYVFRLWSAQQGAPSEVLSGHSKEDGLFHQSNKQGRPGNA